MAAVSSHEGDQSPVCLLVLAGLPAAGKTTLAIALGQHAKEHGIEVRHICFDEHGCQPPAAQVGGGSGCTPSENFTAEAWQHARQAALRHLQAHLITTPDDHASQQSLGSSTDHLGSSAAVDTPTHGSAVASKRLVIADDNMQYRSMREECYKLARRAGTAVALLYVRCGQQAAQLRNSTRPTPQCVPQEVITRMAASFEEPAGCGSWEHGRTIVWSSETGSIATSLPSLWRQICDLWGAPPPPPLDAERVAAARAAAQAATAASRIHAADVTTRQLLSRCMQRFATAPAEVKAAAAQRLNAARRDVLEQARQAEEAAGGRASPLEPSRWGGVFQRRCDAVLRELEWQPGS